MAARPADRHGGPGAGWYRPGPDGWQRISDAEAAEQRYPDMAHFMHDPREAAMVADAVTLERAAEIIAARSTKPDSVTARALVKVLTRQAAVIRREHADGQRGPTMGGD